MRKKQTGHLVKTNPIKANFPSPKARLGVGQAVARSGKVCACLGGLGRHFYTI